MTVLAALMLTVQVLAVPVQAPLQPAKVEPVAALAVRVTLVFPRYSSLQLLPQLMPAGLLVTVPEPVPVVLTVRL